MLWPHKVGAKHDPDTVRKRGECELKDWGNKLRDNCIIISLFSFMPVTLTGGLHGLRSGFVPEFIFKVIEITVVSKAI